ncbi:MAG TPA: AAA family ATPase [Candidatus Acidoferrum sp.]|jgi:replication-associated recombination protein RarA|nr:AAA family ATPase [Candidatus Acidoferrum sp.]
MNELIARCAGQFIPKSADDFVGENIVSRQSGDQTGARLVARQIEKAVRLANQNGQSPLKFLFNGKPGLGKSALVQYLQHLTGCNKWSTTKLNGTECKMERIEAIATNLHHKNLFGDWRMLWIDEADEIPRVAQVRFLTLLDDLPPGVIVACTSNCTLADFENRFQTRFQVFEIAPPPPAEIQNLLVRIAPEISPRDAGQIANFACGNVRQALLDAQGALQQLA